MVIAKDEPIGVSLDKSTEAIPGSLPGRIEGLKASPGSGCMHLNTLNGAVIQHGADGGR